MDGSTFSFTSPKIGVLAASFLRFPAAMLAALVFAAVNILEVHQFIKLPLQENILYACIVAFFALLATELVAEAKSWRALKRLFACIMIMAAVAGWCAIAGTEIGLPHWLFGCAMFTFCIAAPAFGGASNEELWQFNQQSFLGLAIAGIATGILLAGAGAILYALSTLFGMRSDNQWFFTVAVLSYAVFWPAYTITFMPKLPQNLAAPPMMPGPLAFVLTFVALPVLLIFGALIAAYGISVLGLNANPIASVGWMVMGFSACGIALHFLLFPMRHSGNILVRWFEKYFFIILVPMLGLLFWAVLIRVREYGVTENRYMALLGGFWAVAMALAAFMRRGDVKLGNAPAALALLLVMASLGPWSAENLSFTSQSARLKQALSELGVYRNGHVVEPESRPEASWEQRSNISSLLDYFRNRRDDRMPDYLRTYGNIDLINSSGWSDAIMHKWQMRYIDSWQRRRGDGFQGNDTIYFYADEVMFGGQRSQPLEIAGYSWMLQFNTVTQQMSDETNQKLNEFGISTVVEDSKLLVRFGGSSQSVDVLALLPQPLDDLGSTVNKPMLVTSLRFGEAELKLMVTNLNAQRRNGVWYLGAVNGNLLVRP